MSNSGFIPLSEAMPNWPSDLAAMPPSLNQVGLQEFDVISQESPEQLIVRGTLVWFQEWLIDLALIPGFSIAFLHSDDVTTVDFELEVLPSFYLRIPTLDINLTLRNSLLRPVKWVGDVWESDLDNQGNPRPLSLLMSGIGLEVDRSSNIAIAAAPSFNLGAVTIGDTGFVVELFGVQPILAREQMLPHVPSNFRGLSIKRIGFHFPADFDLDVAPGQIEGKELLIGSDGFSGTIQGIWETPIFDNQSKAFAEGNGVGTLLGIPFALRDLSLILLQSRFARSSVRGAIVLPFFDHPINVEIGFAQNGYTVALASTPQEGSSEYGDLLSFEKSGILKVAVASIAFEQAGAFLKVKLDGVITPLIAGIDWPGFEVSALSIDSEGNVDIEGGWIDLPNQYQLDFHGFKLDINQFGMGRNDDGSRWIGLNGGLQLLGDLPAGAAVEGLRITWDENGLQGIRFDGIGLTFEIPEVLRFSGQVAYVQEGDDHRFEGAIALNLIALKLQIDAKLVIGRTNGYTYLAIYVGAELPAGIPLATTGLAFYGLAGLYAQNMEPGKTADQQWYSIDRTKSWYHSGEQPGVAVLSKWEPQRGSIAIGAGVTLGTVSDNGFAFNGKLLLAVLLPGPVILLEGRANLLSPRADLDKGEPTFRTLAVLDNREDSLLFGLDAQYKFDSEKGRLLDIRAGAEAFYSFSDPLAWYCYLGKREPRDQRIAARMYSLFEATAYYMLDAQKLQLGAAIGFDLKKSAGPLRVTLAAWIEAAAVLNWSPAHFFGELLLHGTAQLSAFGVGLGLSINARVAADVFDPLHIIGTLSVALKTPPFLPDPEMDVTIEWGPIPDPPPLPLPLKSISIEHFKTSTKWPLPRTLDDSVGLLRPNYEQADTGYRVAPQGSADLPPLEQIPVVPVDARPHLTFAQPVDDVARVGINPAPVGWVVIGDPEKGEGPVKARYSLSDITLEKQFSGRWITVARSPNSDEDFPTLFGSWAPVPPLPLNAEVTQDAAHTPVKLWLWSKNPFNYTLNTSREWEDWFLGENASFPCVNVPQQQTRTYNFERVPLNTPLVIQQKDDKRLWISPDRVTFRWPQTFFEKTVNGTVSQVNPQVVLQHSDGLTDSLRSQNITRALMFEFVQFDEPLFLDIELPNSYAQLTLSLYVDFSVELALFGLDENDLIQTWAHQSVSAAGLVNLEISGKNVKHIRLYHDNRNGKKFHLLQIIGTVISSELIAERQQLADHLQAQTQRWGQVGNVLEPHQTYRLKVTTQITARGEKKLSGYEEELEQVEFAYFRTGAPPAAQVRDRMPSANLSIPIGHPNPPQFASGLEDLRPYIAQTIPETLINDRQETIQARPVYRAYDVGVQFNEDYVELMYRQAQRDLGLYLFDNNARPVRDNQGRILPMNNSWGNTDALTLAERDARWIETLKSQSCVSMSNIKVPHASTLTASTVGQLLRPTTAYDARLVPMLLHETFHNIGLLGWQAVQGSRNLWSLDRTSIMQGSVVRVDGMTVHLAGPSDLSTVVAGVHQLMFGPTTFGLRPVYQIVGVNADAGTVMLNSEPELSAAQTYKYDITQPSAVKCIATVGTVAGDSARLGAVLTYGDDTWSDYRFSTYVRITSTSTGRPGATSSTGSFGIVFRQQGDRYYRYSLDVLSNRRQLVKVEGSAVTMIAEDDYSYQSDRDYQLTVEALGAQLRIYQDGTAVFDVEDSALITGAIGLYSWGQDEGSFKDVRVDDLRASAKAAYRFSFITSRYANFHHQIHSYLDETWLATIDTNAISPADIQQHLTHSVQLNSIGERPSYNESMAYDVIAQAAIGVQSRTPPENVEATRVQYGDESIALLLRSPEPIDWSRTTLQVSRVLGKRLSPSIPGALKITNVSFAPESDEGITLLIREPGSLKGARIEYRHGLPDSLPTELSGSDEVFNALLLNESFDSSLDETWSIVDEAPYAERPSRWEIIDGKLAQSQNYYGFVGGAINAPGTYIVAGSENWTNYRVSVQLQSNDDDAIGIICRYIDDDNYYRFSMDRQRAYRRFTKKENGITTVLWEDTVRYQSGKTYDIQIDCQGDRLKLTLEEEELFDITDTTHLSGKVGLYCRANRATYFEHIRVFTPLTAWTPYHLFEEEAQWQEGTIIQLQSSKGAASAVEQYSANAISANATVFSRYGTHVRLVTAEGTVVHALHISQQLSIQIPDLRLWRKSDGTAIALMRKSSQVNKLSVLESGTYRLSFTYHRDNRSRDAGSVVLEQNGSSLPERANINVPWEDSVQ